MGVSNDLKLALCPQPCKRITTTERLLLPGGREELRGEPPPALCVSCPERSNPNPPIRHIEVRCDLRGKVAQEDEYYLGEVY